MSATLNKGEYVLASPEDGKYLILKVRAADVDSVKGMIEQSEVEGKRKLIELPTEQVVLKLGRKPPYGRYLGQLFEPLRGIKHYGAWGDVHYYRKLEKVEKKLLYKALDHVEQELRKHRLTFIFPITIEVREKAGRWEGFYRHDSKIDNVHNHLTVIGPKEFQLDALIYLIRHEMGHAVWFKGVPKKTRARWIRLYTHYLTLTTAKMESIKAVRQGLEEYRDVAEYKAALREDESPLLDTLDECLSYVKSTFNMDNEELGIIVSGDTDLEEYWPKHPLDGSEPNGAGIMTDYGMKNTREFFAEAFRLYLEGKAGKKLTKLMERTFQRLSK